MTINVEQVEAQLKAKLEAARKAVEDAEAELKEFESWKKVGERYASASTPAKRAKVTGSATVKKAKKAVAKKAAPKKAAPKKAVTKAGFIKSQPQSMSAKQVVEAAKEAGISVSETYVYNVRATKKAAAKKAAPKKKAAKKAAPKKKAASTNSVTDASLKNAAEGRRAVATGERPTLKDSMKIVMGKKTMNAQGVVDALAEKKWLPASSDHRQYISFMLSNNCPGDFERTETRGFYKVAKGAAAPSTKNGNGKTKAKKSAAKGKKGPQAKPDPQVDANLKQHWDIDVASSPFKDADAAPSVAPST